MPAKRGFSSALRRRLQHAAARDARAAQIVLDRHRLAAGTLNASDFQGAVPAGDEQAPVLRLAHLSGLAATRGRVGLEDLERLAPETGLRAGVRIERAYRAVYGQARQAPVDARF